MGVVERVAGVKHGRNGATRQRVRQESADLGVELDICRCFSAKTLDHFSEWQWRKGLLASNTVLSTKGDLPCDSHVTQSPPPDSLAESDAVAATPSPLLPRKGINSTSSFGLITAASYGPLHVATTRPWRLQ